MLNHVFWLYKKQDRHKEAYEIGVSIGFLEDAVRLLVDNSPLEWAQPSDLAEVLDYLQAKARVRHLPAQNSHPGNINQLTHNEHTTTDLINVGIKVPSVDNFWKTIDTILGKYPQSGAKPDRDCAKDERMRMLLDILVRKVLLKMSIPTKLT